MTTPIKFLLAGLLSITLASASLAQDKAKPADPPSAPAAAQPPKKDEPKAEPKTEPKKEEKPKVAASTDEYEYVKMSTAKGDVFMRLNKTKAPISTANFLSYTEKKFYDGTLIHRVMKGFVIQGGGFDDKLHEKTAGATIKNESANGLKNKRGTVAMARLSAPDSASCQFYINVKDNNSLDEPQDSTDKNSAYCVFGDVVAGMSVVDQIVSVRTTTKNGTRPDGKPIRLEDTPVENLLINSITKATKEDADKAAAADKK